MRFIVPKKPSAAGASPQTPAGSLWHPHSLVTYLRTWHSGVARNLFRRGQNRETGDRSVPQRGPGAPPEAEDIYANSNCNNAGSIPNFFSMGISGGMSTLFPLPYAPDVTHRALGAQNGRTSPIFSVRRRLWILRPCDESSHAATDDVGGRAKRGRTSLFLPPGAGNPSYATG